MEYLGFREVSMSSDALSAFYGEDGDPVLGNVLGLETNEYVQVNDEDWNEVDVLRWTGEKYRRVPYRTIHGKFLGEVKPRNLQQKMALDMLYDDSITIKVLAGRFGSGKDYLMCSAAMDLIEKSRYEKLVWVRNNIEVKNSKPIGHLPGDYKEKLLPFAMPLADHIGGVDGLEYAMSKGEVEIVHLGFIRGRDIRNSIIMCSESENLTKEHVQLLIGRVGDGSALWLNGDYKQVDMDVFRENSGLMAAVDRLKGHPRFGYVQLMKTERSETAAMADLLD